MNLHDLQPKIITRLMWFYVYGGNGNHVGGDTHAHLYEIERGTPPAIIPGFDPTDFRHYNRRIWQPYETRNLTNEQIVTPLCGRLRTRAQRAYLGNTWGHGRECQACAALAHGPTAIANEVIQADPWTTIRWDQRGVTPDPVTGL